MGFTIGTSEELAKALRSGLAYTEAGKFKVESINGILELNNKVKICNNKI